MGKKVLTRISHCVPQVIFSLVTFVLGAYLMLNLNYLDDPHSTWLPVPWPERYVGFVDDWWFSSLAIIVSMLLLYGVMTHTMWLKRWMMIAIVGIYALLFFSFGVRGFFEGYVNTSWAPDLGMVLVGIWVTLRGERRNAH